MATPFIENIDQDMLDDFQEKTKYNIKRYFKSYIDFYNQDTQNIVDFYEGRVEDLNAPSFQNLRELIKETKILINVFKNNNNLLSNYKYWVLLENVEEIKTNIQHYNNASRWVRSAILKNSYNVEPQISKKIKSRQVLEGVLEEVGSSDAQNDWVDIAIKNALKEEDYDTKGGKYIKIFLKNNKSFYISSVIDNITTDTIYGKDINKEFVYVDNDLEGLSPLKTIKQVVYILANLCRKDNPQQKSHGIDKDLLIGKNINTLAYPALIRQLYTTFKNEDTIASFTIKGITTEKGAIHIDFEVETILYEVIKQKIKLI